MMGHVLSQHITLFQVQTTSDERWCSPTLLHVVQRTDHSERPQSAVSSRIDGANAARRARNSTLMITLGPQLSTYCPGPWLFAVSLSLDDRKGGKARGGGEKGKEEEEGGK